MKSILAAWRRSRQNRSLYYSAEAAILRGNPAKFLTGTRIGDAGLAVRFYDESVIK
jgi:hypothetical protein